MVSVSYTCVFFIFLHSQKKPIEGAVNGRKGEKGPPERKEEMITVLAEVGDDVKITCPVQGDPIPIVEWSKVYIDKRCVTYI